MKLSSDKLMLMIEGKNGKCFIQFDDGCPSVWVGDNVHCFDRIDNIRELENMLKTIIAKVGV